jgi:hypothetical protein
MQRDRRVPLNAPLSIVQYPLDDFLVYEVYSTWAHPGEYSVGTQKTKPAHSFVRTREF